MELEELRRENDLEDAPSQGGGDEDFLFQDPPDLDIQLNPVDAPEGTGRCP